MADTWWKIAIDIAQIVTGFAAAIALFLTVRFHRKEAVAKDRDLAEQVTAWAVTEGEINSDLGEEFLGGVVIRNGTPNTISVKVKTGRRHPSGIEKFDDDGFKGQSFNVIPHGVYYTQQYLDDDDEQVWSAPKPVDTASGRFIVDLPPVQTKGAQAQGRERTVPLVPVSIVPEPKVVTLFEFELAGKHWERLIGGGLRLLKPKAAVPAQQKVVQGEFKESEKLMLAQPKQRQNHQTDTRVQAVFTEVAQYLTGQSLTAEELASSAVEVAARFKDVFTTVRLSKRGQKVDLGLPGMDDINIYFSGSGAGKIPNGVEHSGRATTGCTLKTEKFRSSLEPASGSGAELAEAFVTALRELGEHGAVCSCGTPYVFSTN